MSYMSDILDKANGINPNSTAVDLYLFAKAINDAGIVDVPKIFVQAVKARFFNSTTSDPNELAYLQKVLNYINSWAIQGYWYTGDGNVRTIGNGINSYPLQVLADLVSPQFFAVYSTFGTFDFLSLNRFKIPGWYKDNTLFRVRVWGAGGSGGRFVGNTPNGAPSGGGGGGYAEGLVTLGQIKANPSMVVGQAGAGNTGGTGVSGIAGQNTNFSGLLIGGGGGGGLLNPGPAIGGSGGSGSGSAALFTATGGSGGTNASPWGSSWNFPAGSGGGAAGGPWGAGCNGGDVINSTYDNGGSGGGGTAMAGGAGSTVASMGPGGSGGASAAYQDKWKTAYLLSLGGNAGTSSAKAGGFGAGGSGGNYVLDGNNSPQKNLRTGGNGGAFGGGGGLGAAGYSAGGSADGLSTGNGGIAGGGGGATVSSGGLGGYGGHGLIIVEWFS